MKVNDHHYRFLPHGDAALVIEFGDRIDDDINARVLQLDKALMRIRITGVIEAVPTYRSLLVHYDPLATTFSQLAESIETHIDDHPPRHETNRHWSVPVVYGGDDGVDLDGMADERGMTRSQFIGRHTDTEYRVCMIGFMPGFAYLSGLDPVLAAPRRKQPRPAAPTGTISIGGGQAAIQSVESPSAWHWIGRTPMQVYDPSRTPVSLLEPGDLIRFYPIEKSRWETEALRCQETIMEAAD